MSRFSFMRYHFTTATLAGLLVGAPLIVAGQIANGVYLPGATPYGKTYAQWSAAWWQWADSMPINSHPLYDTAPIDKGQSGPMWFFDGHWAFNSIMTRTGAVPAHVSLMFMIEGTAADNTGCPPSDYPESVLRASVQSVMDQVHDVTFTIDGVAIQNLLPSYRFQSPAFTFVAPADNNILMDRQGEPCYSNPNPGAPPWVVSGAVAEGVYVIVAPLTPGQHTIHFTAQFGIPVSMFEDMTYVLTAVPLVLSGERQGNTFLISWPLVTTNYVIETSATLHSPQWSPVGEALQTLSNRFQMAVPVSPGSQFFRLRN